MVDTKRILRENGGLRKTRDTRGCWPPKTRCHSAAGPEFRPRSAARFRARRRGASSSRWTTSSWWRRSTRWRRFTARWVHESGPGPYRGIHTICCFMSLCVASDMQQQTGLLLILLRDVEQQSFHCSCKQTLNKTLFRNWLTPNLATLLLKDIITTHVMPGFVKHFC
jgi:hypothetical protein